MSELRVLIVDDETLARGRIAGFLKKRAEDIHIEEAVSGVDAVEKLRASNYDLLFLDIQMPEIDGFGVLEQIERRDFQVIFQTAHDEFAVKAFEENACDYLLKPFDELRFNKAFERAINRPNASPIGAAETARAKAAGLYMERLIVRQGTKSIIVPIGEILAFVSRDHYTFLVTEKGEMICDVSLNHLEERLNPSMFRRLHRNNIVASSAVRAVHNGANMEVELSNRIRLPVSRSNRGAVKSHSL